MLFRLVAGSTGFDLKLLLDWRGISADLHSEVSAAECLAHAQISGLIPGALNAHGVGTLGDAG